MTLGSCIQLRVLTQQSEASCSTNLVERIEGIRSLRICIDRRRH
ncbi:MAG: hypothetical protein ACK5O3_17010 [Burkholderiales bacterium]